MKDKKVKEGQTVADKIRKLLFNIDLRIVDAEGEIKVAKHDFDLNSKIDSPKHRQNAAKAKMRKECYIVYLDNLKKTKQEIRISLDKVLTRYNSKYQKIWTMYFIEKKSIDDIVNEVSYTRDNINKIVQKFKIELANYAEERSES